MSETPQPPQPRRWAELRFAVVGPLLVSPPKPGELSARIEELAAQLWVHPSTGKPVRFGHSTIERWYYSALEAQDPLSALMQKARTDRGCFHALNPAQQDLLRAQYREHPSWTMRLHSDNLREYSRNTPELGALPSYATVRRFLRANGLVRRRRRGPLHSPGGLQAEQRLFTREVRSYEHAHTHALWHLDFHACSRQVFTAAGQRVSPQLLAVIDDHSRLICHAQWYLLENAEHVVHGLTQAILKRGLPRALMTDRGQAMLADEVVQGFGRLGIHHDPTLAYSPDQNGKIESFWGRVETRLMAMLEGEMALTLAALNEATHAWIEREYHREVHGETKQPPIERFLEGPDLARPSPTPQDLKRAFCAEVMRTQRRADATISVASVRFEVPNRLRHVRRLTVRYSAWDLSSVLLIEPRTNTVLATIYPVDKQRNADGRRRLLVPPAPKEPGTEGGAPAAPSGIAPLLRRYIEEHAATGLPAPYIPTAAETETTQPTATTQKEIP